jgi:hypothetical protein
VILARGVKLAPSQRMHRHGSERGRIGYTGSSFSSDPAACVVFAHTLASKAKRRSSVRNPLTDQGRRTLGNSTHAPPTVTRNEAARWPRRSPRRGCLDLAGQWMWERRSAGFAASQWSHRCCCAEAASVRLLGRSIDRKAARGASLRIRAPGRTAIQLQHGLLSSVGADSGRGRGQQVVCCLGPGCVSFRDQGHC